GVEEDVADLPALLDRDRVAANRLEAEHALVERARRVHVERAETDVRPALVACHREPPWAERYHDSGAERQPEGASRSWASCRAPRARTQQSSVDGPARPPYDRPRMGTGPVAVALTGLGVAALARRYGRDARGWGGVDWCAAVLVAPLLFACASYL